MMDIAPTKKIPSPGESWARIRVADAVVLSYSRMTNLSSKVPSPPQYLPRSEGVLQTVGPTPAMSYACYMKNSAPTPPWRGTILCSLIKITVGYSSSVRYGEGGYSSTLPDDGGPGMKPGTVRDRIFTKGTKVSPPLTGGRRSMLLWNTNINPGGCPIQKSTYKKWI